MPSDKHSDKPLVSVIMPAFNCAKYVGMAIESILTQSYDNWELLIVDDASQDDTFEVLKKYQSQDSRITIYSNQKNKGAAFSRNFLIKEAAGEYIMLQDADDLSDNMRIEKQLDFLFKNNHDACGTFTRSITEDGVPIQKHDYHVQYQSILWSLFGNFSFCHASLMMKSAYLKEPHLYDESFHSESEDLRFLGDLLLGARLHFGNISEYLYTIRKNTESVSFVKKDQQRQNSIINTSYFIKKLGIGEVNDSLVLYLKYFHKMSDQELIPDQSDIPANFEDLKKLYFKLSEHFFEGKVLKQVKFDVARKLYYLALNYKKTDLLKSLRMIFEVLKIDLTVLKLHFGANG